MFPFLEKPLPTSKHLVLIGLLISAFLYLTIRIISSPAMILNVPDDGFYYLQLAKHFAQSGQWTFDGVHATNGFHLLWAYLLAGISFVFNPSIDAYPIIAISTSLLIISATIIYIGKDQSAAVIIWIGYLITNQYFIINAISLTEFPLVILCAYCVLTNRKPFIFSILGVLARTDFIIVPLIFSLETIATGDKIKDNYKTILGGLIGMAIITIHSYITTGDIVQVSAMIKNDWAYLYGDDLLSDKSLSLTTNYFYVSTHTLKQAVMIIILATGVIIARFNKKNRIAYREITVSAAVMTVYTGLYWTYAGVQSWYAANLFIPLLLIGGHAIETITGTQKKER